MSGPETTRRGLLAGAGLGAVACATPAPAAAAASPLLSTLFESYRSAYAAYEKISEDVVDPARAKCRAAMDAAKASIPHIEMTMDVSWSEWSDRDTQVYSTADRVTVVCAQVCAETVYEPADQWSPEQHKLFAEKRAFHAARLERDARIAHAVAEARREHDPAAAIEQEEAAWARTNAIGEAVIDYPPRSLADLAAKLAFYEETSLLPDEAILEWVAKDVATLGGVA